MIQKKRLIAFFVACAIFLPLSSLYAGDDQNGPGQALRRFALFVGANNGGAGRTRLLYAVSDSEAMASVLYEVGGLRKQDSIVSVDPTPEELDRQILRMRSIIRSSVSAGRVENPERTEFLLYYSGHSDENGLLLGGRRYSYRDLRNALKSMETDVSIAILDSCDSGAFIRLKGGQRVSPFLVDESSRMKGEVFLTSSSEDEASQESDAIGGSFFTHALISGLRGAADVSQDGKITLHEAYQFARSETTARTENTAAGPQHPAWHIELTGTGDLVLTDIRSLSAGLTLAADIDGRVAVRDGHGKLVVEIHKTPGTPLSLALPPGQYRVVAGTSGTYLEASVSLRDGAWSNVSLRDFSRSGRIAARSRGGESPPTPEGDFLSQDWGLADAGRVLENTVKNFLRRRDGTRDPRMAENASDQTASAGTSTDSSREADVAPDPLPGDSTEQRPNFAENEGHPTVPVSLSFVPGIGVPPFAFQSVKSLSFNILVGESYAIHGAEFGSIINIVTQDVDGAQFSGVGNVVGGDVGWAQAAGVFNIAGGRLNGLQAAGVFNIAGGGVAGMQAAGVFNVAGGLKGVQMGLVNVAEDTDGFQFGLVNIAGKMHGLALGLVNISRNGLVSLSVSTDSTGMTVTDFQSGQTLYTVLFGGFKQPADSTDPLVTYGVGLGLHFDIGPFFTEVDLSAKSMFTASSSGTTYPVDTVPFMSARAKAGILMFGHFGGYIGGTFDIAAPWDRRNPYAHAGTVWNFGNGDTVAVYPKLTAGVTIRM